MVDRNEYAKKYYEIHKEKIKTNHAEHKEEKHNYDNEYRIRRKEQIKAYQKANKEKFAKQAKEYREKHKERIKERQREYYKAHPNKVQADARTTTSRYSRLKASAKRRGKECNLTLEQYAEIIKPECFYCDGYFGRVETGTGIDRLNSKLGYVVGNCVSCCEECNKIKGPSLTPDETRFIVQALIQYRKAKPSQKMETIIDPKPSFESSLTTVRSDSNSN